MIHIDVIPATMERTSNQQRLVCYQQPGSVCPGETTRITQQQINVQTLVCLTVVGGTTVWSVFLLCSRLHLPLKKLKVNCRSSLVASCHKLRALLIKSGALLIYSFRRLAEPR